MTLPSADSRLTDEDLYLFHEGSHFRIHDRMGAHLTEVEGRPGVSFAVFAPAARRISVVGEFNGWDPAALPMSRRGDSGVWEAFAPGVGAGATYKYHLVSKVAGYTVDKSDPCAFWQELPPRTASRVCDLSYSWGDEKWMGGRAAHQALDRPMSLYEVHLGSWLRGDGNRHLTYAELAPRLLEHVRKTGFTHVQLLPILEHPFYGTWGYGVTGYFAPTSRYGSPTDFMAFVDHLHRGGVGVFLDWVPAHFPSDETGLGFFDGTHLYEHADPRKGFHPDWNSLIFNLGRPEVVSFLISSAMFWLERFHIDGLRVDAVASMLYLDYSRDEGEWVPNEFGGKENLEAIEFLRKLNRETNRSFPDVHTVAEESTSWPMVTRPIESGGLGFGLKWDMGWMHDTLKYLAADPLFRKGQQSDITFRQIYSDAENFMLPLSHDEVVHGKGSLFGKMPGDDWQKAANLRLLFAWMYAQNGKKLLFMGGEFGQRKEWDHESDLQWSLLEDPTHAGIMRCVEQLNRLYVDHPAMHTRDVEREGFEWIDCQDVESSVVSLFRQSRNAREEIVGVFNFTPIPRDGYRVGVPHAGEWRVVLDTDGEEFGGSGYRSGEVYSSEEEEWHGRGDSIVMSLPPLAALFLRVE